MSSRRPPSPPLEALLRGSSLHEPPRDVLHRAFALKDRLPQAPESLGSRAEAAAAWVLRLVFDSGLQPVPAGLRSAGSSERRLLYEAQAGSDASTLRQVDVRVRREPGGTVEVLGQCLPPWPAASVEARSGRSRRESGVDEAGEFLLRGLPGKASSLELRLLVDGRPVLTLDAVPVPDPAA